MYACRCRRYVETNVTLKKLYLVAIARSDAGNYSCRLDTQEDTLEKAVTLIIYSK